MTKEEDRALVLITFLNSRMYLRKYISRSFLRIHSGKSEKESMKNPRKKISKSASKDVARRV